MGNFSLLIRKNIKTSGRLGFNFLLEVIIIVAIFLILYYNPVKRTENDKSKSKDVGTNFLDANNITSFQTVEGYLNGYVITNMKLSFTPRSAYAKRIAKNVVKKLNMKKAMGYKNETVMISQFNPQDTLAAIIFPKPKENGGIPEDFTVTIRFPSTFRTVSDFEIRDNLWVTRCSGSDEVPDAKEDLYIREGFLQLQDAIYFEYIQIYYESLNDTEKTRIGQLDTSPFTIRPFIFNVPLTCTNFSGSRYQLFLYYFAFLFTFLRLISRFGREVQENVLVHHWKYGVRYPTHWCAHFWDSLFRLIVLDIIIFLTTKLIVMIVIDDNAGTFIAADPVLLILFLLLNSIAMILFAIFIVCLVQNRKNAIIVGIICWIAFYSFFSTVLERIDTIKSIPLFIGCVLFFNNFFSFGYSFMKRMDEGLTDSEEFLLIFIPIGINIILYFILICIVQKIYPGRYMNGASRKKEGKEVEENNSSSLEPTPSWTNFETVPSDFEEYVNLNHVSANDSGVKKLKNISMTICKGEITVILGHHGSGKTTLVKVLTGMRKPSDGHVKFLDKDIYINWKNARGDCDFCLSTNPLFYYLTVHETFEYFSKIKMPKADTQRINTEVNKCLELLKPVKFISSTQQIKTLDYDGKRLVHLCCVLTGDTKIIILDEPTSYMRLMEQRVYWNILRKQKTNRAIILTTFSCDEAEAIGDRIGVLNMGILRAYGSQFFLKTKFGHYINMTCKVTDNASIENITTYIRKYFYVNPPDSKIGDEIVYKLPGDKRHIYENMLVHLVRDKSQLNVLDVKVYSYSIAEIYLKLGEQRSAQLLSKNEPNYKVIHESTAKIAWQQIYAMIFKKLKYLPHLIIFLLFVLIFAAIMSFLNPLSDMLSTSENREYEIRLGQRNDTDIESLDFREFRNCNSTFITFIDHMKMGDDSVPDHVYTNHSLVCMDKKFVQYMKEDSSLDFRPLGAITVAESNITVWYNMRVLHSASFTLDLAENYRITLMETGQYYRVINKPLPMSLNTRVDLVGQEMLHIIVPLVIGLTMPLVLAFFTLPLVDERCKNVFILQIMAGVSLKIYWGITFICDMFTFFVYNIILTLVMIISTFKGFSLSHKMIMFGLINVYSFAGLFLVYLVSTICHKKVSRSVLVVTLLVLLTGIFSYVLYWEVFWVSDVYFYIASLFPTFSLLDGISNIYLTEKEINFCREECKASTGCIENETMCEIIPHCCSVDFLKWGTDGILTNIAYMVAAGIILIITMTCFVIGEKERKYSTGKDLKVYQSACHPYDDAEVVKLKKTVANLDLRDIMHYRMVADQLESKLTTEVHVLNTISFAADRGHSLCIFGHRHAGKTNFIKQLVGESGYKFGEVYVEGYEFKSDLIKAYNYMSYVPKSDGLFYAFTPRSFLTFFLLIRGIVRENISKIIRQYKIGLDMGTFIDQKIKYLSSDQKRIVSIALALAQNTTVVIMDEPTTGISTNVSHQVWLAIRFAQSEGRTIIFTSVSCLEAKHIGDNLILYQDNEMLAYGSISYLRGLYTVGFYIEVKLARDNVSPVNDAENLAQDIDNLQQFMIFLHKDSELLTRVDNVLKYYCPVVRIRFTVLYGALEHNRTRLNILDYTINEGSMWDVVYNIDNARRNFVSKR
ncbi:ATP-binding cassette sub-family A member 5-like [Teleopsis dalmanni]|uniref:ATP-binding cassette sub-family A member 5-like n=1 Tax=Teleopsis dalmanni TaxID=139649 RepID=UPI0018CD2CEB|nr:ATP-binding cassette sub-family A member 5-like [Teleopsis dalmanni]